MHEEIWLNRAMIRKELRILRTVEGMCVPQGSHQGLSNGLIIIHKQVRLGFVLSFNLRLRRRVACRYMGSELGGLLRRIIVPGVVGKSVEPPLIGSKPSRPLSEW